MPNLTTADLQQHATEQLQFIRRQADRHLKAAQAARGTTYCEGQSRCIDSLREEAEGALALARVCAAYRDLPAYNVLHADYLATCSRLIDQAQEARRLSWATAAVPA